MKKILVSIILCICIVFSLTSCGASNSEIKEYTVNFIDALLTNDCEGAYSLMVSETDYESFTKVFSDMYELVSGATDYELEQTSFYTGIQNGLFYTQVTYLMTTEDREVQVATTMCKGYEGIYYIQLTPIYN